MREHGHLGTMGEQCCALHGLPTISLSVLNNFQLCVRIFIIKQNTKNSKNMFRSKVCIWEMEHPTWKYGNGNGIILKLEMFSIF